MGTRLHIQGVPGGSVNILGGNSIGRSKQKKMYNYMCDVMLRNIRMQDASSGDKTIRR